MAEHDDDGNEMIPGFRNVITLPRRGGNDRHHVEPINEKELVKLKIRKIDVLDGKTANRLLTRDMLARGLIMNDPENPNIYINDENMDERLKGRLAHVSRIIEDRMKTRMPERIAAFQAAPIRAKDCMILDGDRNLAGFSATPIIDGIPVLACKKRESMALYTTGENGIEFMKHERYFENVIADIMRHVTFTCIFTGILVKREEWHSDLVLVDIHVTNGIDISDLPYHERHVYLQDLSSLLLPDAFSIITLHPDVNKFVEENGNKIPFFLVDMNNRNEPGTFLTIPVAFPGIEDDPDRIVFGSMKPVTTKDAMLENADGTMICVTGRWKDGLSRIEVKKLIEDHGWTWMDTVNKKTTFLVVASSPGSKKIEKADLLGVPKVPMDDFINLMLEWQGQKN